MRPDELPFVVRCSRRISKESSSRRTMRLEPVFMLETQNHADELQMFAQGRPDPGGGGGGG